MWEFLDGLHKALHIEETWKFVLLMALVGASIFAAAGWVIDASYKNSSEYRGTHPPKVPSATAASDNPVAPVTTTPMPIPSVTRQELQKTKRESEVPHIGDNNTLVNAPVPPKMGSGNTIVGPTDANGNTIYDKSGTAIGNDACAGSTGTAIGAGSKAGDCSDSRQPSPKQ